MTGKYKNDNIRNENINLFIVTYRKLSQLNSTVPIQNPIRNTIISTASRMPKTNVNNFHCLTIIPIISLHNVTKIQKTGVIMNEMAGIINKI